MSISISPINLSGLAGVPALAFQLLSTGNAVDASSSTLNETASTVRLSSAGQLLSVLSSFENEFTKLQNGSTDLSAKAVGFVEATKLLQSNISNLQVVFDALSDTTVFDQSLQTIIEAASVALAPDNQTLSGLQGIGINFQNATLPGARGGVTLSIDQITLAAAIQNDFAGTSAVLAQATLSVLDQIAGIKEKIVGTTISLTNLSLSGLSAAQKNDLNTVLGLNSSASASLNKIAPDLLQNLPADVVLNNLELDDLDLAKVGLDADTIVSDSTVRREALAELLLSLSSTSNTPVEELLIAANDLIASDSVLTTPALDALPTMETPQVPNDLAANEIPAAINLTLPSTNPTTVTIQDLINTALVVNTEAAQADHNLSLAALALQNLLDNPALRAINNNRFDPAYAAIAAAAHLDDFVPPSPLIARSTPYPDIPTPVVPVAPARGIAYYKESAGNDSRW